MHEDDADVTLNVCLGRVNPTRFAHHLVTRVCVGLHLQEFSGATLTFCGLVTDANHRKMQYTYSHEKALFGSADAVDSNLPTTQGRAVLHLGRQRHGAAAQTYRMSLLPMSSPWLNPRFQDAGADDIASGERVNFILWSVSEKYRSSEVASLQLRLQGSTDVPGLSEPPAAKLIRGSSGQNARHLTGPWPGTEPLIT